MAYDKKKILKDALELIEKHHLIFIDDVVGLLPISKKTFYLWFTPECDELHDIKRLLDKNGTPREQKQDKDALVIKWNDLNAG